MKKIITVSYYADFSRFFHYSTNHIEKSFEWLNLCVYPSAYFYSLMHGVNAKFLPFIIRSIESVEDEFDISSKELDDLIKYHASNEKIKQCAIRYLKYYSSLIESFQPDLIILSGDSRLQVTCLSFVAKRKGVKILYFEQGPLNTTILDFNGVNANCSFRQGSDISYDYTAFEKAKGIKPEKWKGYKKFRLIDIAADVFFSKIFFENAKYNGMIFFRIKKLKINKVLKKRKYFLLILQVPEDANMVLHSPFFDNHYSIVKTVNEVLPDDVELVVREHPLYIGLYEKELYDYISKSEIILDSNQDLKFAIENSELVIVNNSTVGLETLYLGKPLVVLGDSYYDGECFVYKYNGSNLEEIFKQAIENPKDIGLINKRLNYLFNEHFIEGHFRDRQPNRFLKVGEKINDLLD